MCPPRMALEKAKVSKVNALVDFHEISKSLTRFCSLGKVGIGHASGQNGWSQPFCTLSRIGLCLLVVVAALDQLLSDMKIGL